MLAAFDRDAKELIQGGLAAAFQRLKDASEKEKEALRLSQDARLSQDEMAINRMVDEQLAKARADAEKALANVPEWLRTTEVESSVESARLREERRINETRGKLLEERTREVTDAFDDELLRKEEEHRSMMKSAVIRVSLYLEDLQGQFSSVPSRFLEGEGEDGSCDQGQIEVHCKNSTALNLAKSETRAGTPYLSKVLNISKRDKHHHCERALNFSNGALETVGETQHSLHSTESPPLSPTKRKSSNLLPHNGSKENRLKIHKSNDRYEKRHARRRESPMYKKGDLVQDKTYATGHD